MPKYKITEVDNTGSLSLNEQSNVVYIPGGGVRKYAKLCKTQKELDDMIGSSDKDSSYYLASRLISLGMQVLYEMFKTLL